MLCAKFDGSNQCCLKKIRFCLKRLTTTSENSMRLFTRSRFNIWPPETQFHLNSITKYNIGRISLCKLNGLLPAGEKPSFKRFWRESYVLRRSPIPIFTWGGGCEVTRLSVTLLVLEEHYGNWTRSRTLCESQWQFTNIISTEETGSITSIGLNGIESKLANSFKNAQAKHTKTLYQDPEGWECLNGILKESSESLNL
jgi:hypothetical protein